MIIFLIHDAVESYHWFICMTLPWGFTLIFVVLLDEVLGTHCILEKRKWRSKGSGELSETTEGIPANKCSNMYMWTDSHCSCTPEVLSENLATSSSKYYFLLFLFYHFNYLVDLICNNSWLKLTFLYVLFLELIQHKISFTH